MLRKETIKSFFQTENTVRAAHAESDFVTQLNICFAASGLFLIAFVLGILVRFEPYLLAMTFGSTACLFAASFVSKKKRNIIPAMMTLTLVVSVMFTLFTILEKNNGFSAMWLVLIPPIMIVIINLKIGMAVSGYFLFLLIALFWTPLRSIVGFQVYTDTFMIHFPILYLLDYVLSIYLGYTMFTYQYRLLEQQNALKERMEGHLEQMSSKYENAEYRASHDVLTGLLNREHLKEMRAEGIYDHLQACGIIYFDLNGLKMLNDTYGHKTGDEYIRLTADSIGYFANSNCHCYRLGGDEFMMVMLNQTEDDMNELVRRWKGFLKQLCKERGMNCSVAVGSSFAAGDYLFDHLMKIADEKMYENKRQTGQERR